MNKDKNDIQLDGLFYEIDYDASPIEGVGKYILKPQKIQAPIRDEVRELFYRMRDISRQYPAPFRSHSYYYAHKAQENNSRVFYKQALFMKDFEDNYPHEVPFSSYFPYYQLMGYEQLRTYFTWRTHVRKGTVNNTSLSYAYLYIYELLNNVGVDSPQEGLEKLIFFWSSFRAYDSSIDKYIIRWLKDYYIYYGFPQTFKDFIREHNLIDYYPNLIDIDNRFDLLSSISKYDIRKSIFYTDETHSLIKDCFCFVLDRISQAFNSVDLSLDDLLFCPTKKIGKWKPFKAALFSPWYRQSNRRVLISENEIYICNNNEWTFSTTITSEKGRKFIGYITKQMESILRRLTKHKFKLTANINMMDQDTLDIMKKAGLYIDKIIETAVLEFYREATKTVVEVDPASLERIRQEALITQEALTVEDHEEPFLPTQVNISLLSPEQNKQEAPIHYINPLYKDVSPIYKDFTSTSNNWDDLKEALDQLELQALTIILHKENDIQSSIKNLADNHNIMMEVLLDQINEKAMDYIGDNILDEELSIYEDYEEQIKGMVDYYDK